MRVGVGYDSHRFEEARPLVLGGVTIPGAPGLRGHSDGDAVAHAVIDAVLGAAGAGDIGTHFPPDDPRWKGADSIGLLRKVGGLLRERALRVGNVDLTVICERPPIAPHAPAMAERLSEALSVRSEVISVKGKSNEGMGWIGAGEGLAVIAVATVAHLSAAGPDGSGSAPPVSASPSGGEAERKTPPP